VPHAPRRGSSVSLGPSASAQHAGEDVVVGAVVVPVAAPPAAARRRLDPALGENLLEPGVAGRGVLAAVRRGLGRGRSAVGGTSAAAGASSSDREASHSIGDGGGSTGSAGIDVSAEECRGGSDMP